MIRIIILLAIVVGAAARAAPKPAAEAAPGPEAKPDERVHILCPHPECPTWERFFADHGWVSDV